MKFHKRLIAVLLAAVMTAGLLPTAYGAQADAAADTAEADRAFAAIDTALDNLSAKKAAATEAAKSEAAKEAVEALGYTVTEHGSQFTWVADGITCVYSPRLRRIAETATPIDGYVDDGQIVTVDYSRRGTGPDSKNVALIEPYYGLDSNFTTQYQTECSSIAAATLTQPKPSLYIGSPCSSVFTPPKGTPASPKANSTLTTAVPATVMG